MKYEPLILIGAANKCFDCAFNLIKEQVFDFLFVKEKDQPVSLMLLQIYQPYLFDSQALLSYMYEKDLPGIEVHGGGKCEPTSGSTYIQIFGASQTFKTVHLQRAFDFFKNEWPFKTVDVKDIAPISKADLCYHRYYSIDEIMLLVRRAQQMEV